MKARIFTLAAAVTIAATPLAAQSATANFNATATVVSALSVAQANDLAFGNVFPGVPATVVITDANAALIEFAGANNAEVTLQFGALPTNLSDGTNNLAISFVGNTAGVNTVNNPATATSFDPTVLQTVNLSGSGALFSWLGGTVSPIPAQVANNYTAALTLVATYTGN